MAYDLTDLSDIVSRVCSQVKIDPNDSVEIAKIKADINDVYLDKVVPFKRWFWLSGHTDIEHKPFFSSGTVSVTPDSTAITFSIAPTTSKKGYYFSVQEYGEIYEIAVHTAGQTSATLTTKFTGALSAVSTFRVWTDKIALPTNFKEMVEVWHDFSRQPLDPTGIQDFRRRVTEAPKQQGRPVCYLTYDFEDPTPDDAETESDRYRLMKVYPSLWDTSTTLHIDYTKEALPLSLDGDEPLMPIGDRMVLVYGALQLAWLRHRNPEAAATNRDEFNTKLARMAGNVEDSTDKPQLTPDSRYLARKRAKGIRSSSRFGSFSGGSGYTAPDYLKNVTIEGGNLTANLTANSGILIDGRDVSADGAALDAMVTLANGKIYIGNASNVSTEVTPSGDVTIDNTGVTAIAAGVIVNADINASAAIDKSKIAAGSTGRVEVTDGSGLLAESAITSTELTYLSNVEALTSATLADNTSSATNVTTWTLASFDSLFIEYSLKRGSSNKEIGRIHLCTDGTNAGFAQGVIANLGTLGVTFTADVSSGSLRLRYTTTSTGTAVTMKYRVQKWLA